MPSVQVLNIALSKYHSRAIDGVSINQYGVGARFRERSGMNAPELDLYEHTIDGVELVATVPASGNTRIATGFFQHIAVLIVDTDADPSKVFAICDQYDPSLRSKYYEFGCIL